MEFFTRIGLQVLDLLLPSLATVLAGFLVAVASKYLKKLGIEVTDAQDARLRQLVRDGIMAAEEAAHREPLTSKEKNAIAVNQVLTREPDIQLDTVKRVVDQVLPSVRVELGKDAAPAAEAPDTVTPGTFGRG